MKIDERKIQAEIDKLKAETTKIRYDTYLEVFKTVATIAGVVLAAAATLKNLK